MLQKCSPRTQTVSVVLTETTVEQPHANVYRLIVPLTFIFKLQRIQSIKCFAVSVSSLCLLSLFYSFCFWATILMKMQLIGARSQVPIQDIATEMSDTSTKKRYRGKAFYKMKENQVN